MRLWISLTYKTVQFTRCCNSNEIGECRSVLYDNVCHLSQLICVTFHTMSECTVWPTTISNTCLQLRRPQLRPFSICTDLPIQGLIPSLIWTNRNSTLPVRRSCTSNYQIFFFGSHKGLTWSYPWKNWLVKWKPKELVVNGSCSHSSSSSSSRTNQFIHCNAMILWR